MKSGRSLLMLVAVFGLFVFLGSVAAESEVKVGNIVKEDVYIGEFLAVNTVNYMKTNLSEMPEMIRTSVAAKYSAYIIDEAFKGSDGSYRLILKRDGKKIIVYFNKNGEFQKEEVCVSAQTV